MRTLRALFAPSFVWLLAGALLTPVARAQDVTRKEFDELKQQVAAMKTQVEDLSASVKGDDTTLTSINQRLRQLNDALQRQIDVLNDKVAAVATTDGDAIAPSILGNMEKNPSFRQQMSKVVQGRIVVDNRTGFDQFLYINGTRWRAPAGVSYTNVPFGSVQTQLGPYDPVREWTVADWKFVDGGHQLNIGIQW